MVGGPRGATRPDAAAAPIPLHSCPNSRASVRRPAAGDLSRNRTVGLRIGRGETVSDIQASMGGAIAEGVLTSRSAHALAQRLGIQCPIITGIYQVLWEVRWLEGMRAGCEGKRELSQRV